MDKKNLLDQIGRNILDELCEDARISFAELGKRVGLSPPAVIERVRRMEEAGIIKGYHADVELKEIGLPVMAFLQLRCPPEKYEKVISLSNKLTEVRECHHVSGSNSFVFRVAVASIADLEEIISGFSVYGETSTSIILSSPLRKHGRVLDDGS
ncbi:MAG TPA: Lrp/AsnC family transcriptional regulator [Pyrinomonadaceae bacterium]|nr:Lrp/AsnC family transcriptional regulator [Pyrinomonadaceae bacterium]